MQTGEFSEAVVKYSQAIEINPNDGPALFGRGTARARLGKTTEAGKDLAKAMELDQFKKNVKEVSDVYNLNLMPGANNTK